VLLIYDNLETLTKEGQEAIADFLRELPQGSKAIITSRRRGGEGAVWLRVGELDWGAAHGIIENEVLRDAGLANKLRKVERRWKELYDETRGSPLALVHILGLLRVRAALTFDGALAMLRGTHRKDNLVKFVYQEAHKELSSDDKNALCAVSIFATSATFEAWMNVADLSRSALETSIDRLSALSLIDVLEGVENYSIHPLTRTFVREDLLIDSKLVNTLENAYLTYWVNYVTKYSNSKKFDSYYLVEVEWNNIKLAIELLWRKIGLRRGKIKNEDFVRMFLATNEMLQDVLLLHGHWDERTFINKKAYSISLAADNMDVAGLNAYHVAWVNGVYGRNLPSKAKSWVDKCVKLWSKSDNDSNVAEAKRLRGLTAMQNGRLKDAERFLKDSLNIFREIEEEYSVMNVFNDLGRLSLSQERLSLAKRYFQSALDISYEVKSEEGQAFSKANLGDVAIKQQDIAEAQKIYKQALPLAQKVGRVDLIARIKCGLALVWEIKGRENKALPLAKDGLELYERLQHPNLREARSFVKRLMKKIESG